MFMYGSGEGMTYLSTFYGCCVCYICCVYSLVSPFYGGYISSSLDDGSVLCDIDWGKWSFLPSAFPWVGGNAAASA